ncbi:MAG: GIY-YIG nuclease family protein [Lachnospiraceae bacterium]|nr:GIY-YIG nuclease family protein [Lachnospiraceae bacterium]MBR3036866.1 GIY-YIG nuclease family protein [Lachnospiraceae bacterium]
MEEKQNYTYMLQCADGSFYIGWTNDIRKRVQTHNAGKGGKYTRSKRPCRLVYLECFETKQEAQSREVHLKQLTRPEKEALLDGYILPENWRDLNDMPHESRA